MLVSIVVLTYNSENTIKETLDSIISQVSHCDFEVEIIIGDDCSTDGTACVLKEYSNKYRDLITLVINEINLRIILI